MDTKQKVLDKIKKCLALGKSSNANEAATALRQAQALMRKHGITELDIDTLGYSFEHVDIPVQYTKQPPLYLVQFLNMIRCIFAVKPVMGESVRVSDYSFYVHYFGPTARVLTAAYAHTVCWRAMQTSWSRFLKEHPYLRGQRGARSGFFLGWIQEVTLKLEFMRFTDDERAKTEALVVHNGGTMKITANTMKVSNRAFDAGADAAKDFSIHRPMDQSRLRLT